MDGSFIGGLFSGQVRDRYRPRKALMIGGPAPVRQSAPWPIREG